MSRILKKLYMAKDILLERISLRKELLIVLIILITILVYGEIIYLPHPFNIIIGATTIVLSFLCIIFSDVIKKLKPLGVEEDLVYILAHLRSVVTGNPPYSILFKLVGESDFYHTKYRNLFNKIYVLIKHWGYSAPDALRLVSKEAFSRVVEMFLQRLSAVIAIGADVSEYLRIEYNTLFSEYRTAYLRRIDALRVILGVYATLVGAFVFMLANFMLLGLFFGGDIDIIRTGIIGIASAELALSMLLYAFIKRGRLEHTMKIRPRIITYIKIATVGGLASAISFILILGRQFVYSLETAPILMVYIGLSFLPAGLLAKKHEGQIYEIDDFFPVFIRGYGEHLAIVPNMAESLKPILIAELGKLKKFLRNAYARLVNFIDPRIVWNYFAGETGSEMVRRGIHIFMDTVENGGDVRMAGILISDHLNDLIRLRRTMLQVFKTFESTMYLMHGAAILLLTFITKLIVVFSDILTTFVQTIPPEFAGLFHIITVPSSEVAMLTAIATFMITIANSIALMAANPGSKYAGLMFISILMIISGITYYAGQYFMEMIISQVVGGFTSVMEFPS